jgi:hypothetical protein
MRIIFTVLILLSTSLLSSGQILINRDPEIKKMVDEISKEKIEQHVRKLVSFHTRHNLSERITPTKESEPPGTG